MNWTLYKVHNLARHGVFLFMFFCRDELGFIAPIYNIKPYLSSKRRYSNAIFTQIEAL